MAEFPIAQGFYQDGLIGGLECVNLIPQVPQANVMSQAQLVGTPGIVSFATAGSTPARGNIKMDGIAYVVSGTTFYRVNSDGTSTSLGTVTGSIKVSMAENGNQICIVVPGSTAYIYTVSGGLVTITDSNFTTSVGPSQQVKFINGFFVHYNNDSAASSTPIIFVSNLKDGTTYGALDYASAEADPDKITGIHVSRNQLYVGGEKTIEPFGYIGGADFPFQRVSGGVVPKGVKAKFSLIDYDDSYVFVGGGLNEQPAVWKFTGSSGQKISTNAVDKVIQTLTNTEQEEIYCTVYGERGGFFLNVHIKDRVLTFDTMASSLSGGLVWFERKSKLSAGGETVWRVNGIFNAYGKTLVTDLQGGNVGYLDSDIYTEYGTDISAYFTCSPFQQENENITVAEIELVCESGVGNSDVTEPYVTRSYSDDMGATYGNEVSRALGMEGERNKRQIWRRDGQLQTNRIYKFIMAGPFKKVVMKFNADLVLDAA